jgi:hypothetical protein
LVFFVILLQYLVSIFLYINTVLFGLQGFSIN